MESRWQLDLAGRTSARRLIVFSIVLLFWLSCVSSLGFAQIPPQTESIARIKELFGQKRWNELVDEAESISARGAEIDYYYGSALAQLGRWDEARTAFLAGRRRRPSDGRFLIELGGVAFKQKHYSEAARWLRLGLQLEPNDSYGDDFLATIYFLQGNLEAALKYWNRISKPQIENVRVEPRLRIDPALLDRAFAFAPASMLSLRDFRTSRARVGGLGIFPAYSFHLDAQDDGEFDAIFHAQERDGWGNSKWEALLSTFRGAFYQTIYAEYFNLGRSATNISSLMRWDAQKRRLHASLSGPLGGNPKYRYQVGLDLRNENWDLRQSFKGAAPPLGALNLRKEAVNGEIACVSGGRWSWSTGTELSRRDYRSVFVGSALPSDVLLKGYELKQLAQLNYELAQATERRFESKGSVSSESGVIWSAPPHTFEKLQGSVAAYWYPQMSGDDYAMRGQFRAGRTVGGVPFDELFMLGLERDNDLWMRAHIGTRDGRKGSAPLGRNYFLLNWEIDKNLYNIGFFSLKLSPFIDIGKSTDPSPELGSRRWLWDTGVQAKFRIFGVGVMFIYGKDLRSGKSAVYTTAGQ
jgi:tetratricopeptide (TPR) repeat protein